MQNIFRAKSFQQNSLAEALIKLWRSRRSRATNALRQMELLETLPMGGKRQLILVRYANELFLVGGGSDSINCIVKVCSEQDESCG